MTSNSSKSPVPKVCHGDTNLLSVLKVQFPTINFASVKLITLFVTALCRVQTVNYERLVLGFDSTVEKESNLRRIQRFFASYILDHDLVAKLIFKLLPK